jgi:hypothetical protein
MVSLRGDTVFAMEPFIGTEAVRAGALTRSALRRDYRAIHPNVYLPKGAQPGLITRAKAAWLWTGRQGVVAGLAAAAFHLIGIDTSTVELIGAARRPRPGVVIRQERIEDDEIEQRNGLRVTCAARTALDLARHLPRVRALAHLDRLAAGVGLTHVEITEIAARYGGARGIIQARELIPLMDAGSASSGESELRLSLCDSGLRPPATNIMVGDEDFAVRVPMGWPHLRVGVWFEPDPYLCSDAVVRDIHAMDLLALNDWLMVTVVPQHIARRQVVRRVRRALNHRMLRSQQLAGDRA